MRYKTPADGATAERQAVLRYLRRLRKKTQLGDATYQLLLEAEYWLMKRTNRFYAKPGGLGKKAVKK